LPISGPRQVRLVLKRDLDAQTLIDALKDGIHSNLTDPERQELDPVIKQFEDLMRQVGEAKEGDIVVLDMNAAQVKILFNDKILGELSHPDLTPAWLKIGLGKKPAQESLKKALLGLSRTSTPRSASWIKSGCRPTPRVFPPLSKIRP